MTWNFSQVGSPGLISQGFNNFINGYMGIQPDQGLLQGIGTVVGAQMTANGAATYAFRLQGETDKNNTWFKVELFESPPLNNPFSTSPLTP